MPELSSYAGSGYIVMKYRPDIDGLRSLAVIPVVLGHAGIAGFSGGFIGVDIFFVTSGYLITTILISEIQAGTFSILGFYERRARHILPALFVMLAGCMIGGWFIFSPESYLALAQSVVATILFVSNIWFWIGTGDYFGTTVLAVGCEGTLEKMIGLESG